MGREPVLILKYATGRDKSRQDTGSDYNLGEKMAALLSIDTSSRLLGVSKETLLRHARSEKIKAVRIVGRWRIPRSVLESFGVRASDIDAELSKTVEKTA